MSARARVVSGREVQHGGNAMCPVLCARDAVDRGSLVAWTSTDETCAGCDERGRALDDILSQRRGTQVRSSSGVKRAGRA
jgi:hypothetical protein